MNLSSQLPDVEIYLRNEAARLRIAWPASDAHQPDLSVEVRTHTQTQNQRADWLDLAGDIIGIVNDDANLKRFVTTALGQRG